MQSHPVQTCADNGKVLQAQAAPLAHLQHTNILGTRIDALSWEQVLGRILRWTAEPCARVVCLCNVHSLTSTRADSALAQALNRADLNLPDGAPLAWLLRRRQWPEQQRMAGPDLMWRLLREAEKLALPIFLLGSTPATLGRLRRHLLRAFPHLIMAGIIAPPFRTLSATEHQGIAETINRSGARLVLVGLGCPKQEIWMNTQRDSLHAVLVGVGAAFDYHAGTLPRAPLTWQRIGLEWLYRLLQEPRRLARRYLLANVLFLLALPSELRRAR